MAQPTAISLKQFTTTVQAAVKAAVQKNPKFNVPPPDAVAVSYLIRGIPVAESFLAKASFAETQAFADDVAANINAAQPEAAIAHAPGGHGAIVSTGGHLIIGIPAAETALLKE